MALPHNGVCKSAHNIDNQTFKEFKALSGSPALSCRPAARQAVLPHVFIESKSFAITGRMRGCWK